MADAPLTLSALVLAKNEAQKIGRCLDSIMWADEILVVDDLSTDDTAAICRRYGARVVQRCFDNFAAQANFGLEYVRGEWVLSLDADEVVTPALRDCITAAIRGQPGYVGFTFKRLNYFLGRPMRYGGWRHDVLHLFRREAGRFAGKLHHTPQLAGAIGHLDAEVEHYPFQTLTQFIERQNRYSSIQAEEMVEQHGRGLSRHVAWQVAVKPLKLAWKFYVKKQGFRERMHGLVFSALYAWVHLLTWAKYWELTHLTAAEERRSPRTA